MFVTKLDETESVVNKSGSQPSLQNSESESRHLFQLIGENYKDIFLKGLSCEIQGFGIAAYTYYRFVFDQTRFDIAARLVEAAQTDDRNNLAQLQEKYQEALNYSMIEKQLTRMEKFLPDRFLTNARNPLELMHFYFREAEILITSRPTNLDESILEIAKNIRLIWVELSLLLNEQDQ